MLSAFALYLIGFVVWHAFLGKFGASPQSIVQIDFISAALCFLSLCGMFVVPTYMLRDTFRTKQEHERIESRFFRTSLLYGWVIVLVWAAPLYFPDFDNAPQWVFIAPLCLFFIHSAIVIFLWRKSKMKGVSAAIWVMEAFPLYALLYELLTIIRNSHETVVPLLALAFLFASAQELPFDIQIFWSHEKQTGKLFAAIMFVVILVAYAHVFGIRTFGTIPRVVGGGQPETVLVKLSDVGKPVVTLLGLPTTNGLVGPLALLSQSDNSLVVIPAGEFSLATSTTNKVYAREIQRSLVEALFYQGSK